MPEHVYILQRRNCYGHVRRLGTSDSVLCWRGAFCCPVASRTASDDRGSTETRRGGAGAIDMGFGFESQAPFRLPLHLAYRLDSPGVYSIRLTGSHGSEVVVRSAWTEIEVKPPSKSTRETWLRMMAEKTKSALPKDLLRDIVPSLMAWPDDRALTVLLPAYSNWLRRK